MIPPPETIRVTHRRIACDGSGEGIPAALGHPRVFLEIDETGYVDCGYCDRRFILAGGPADGVDTSQLPDHGDGAGR
ncbi:zinc-finger domain-containing protein [Sphingomonas koreensis]|nr:zinc-finger domain-containing protein [Sphingomonas koreensis]TPG41200.1 zinc-finger domain-containing protein [Sphingomonas koreensis]